jgi:hypothetical protein
VRYINPDKVYELLPAEWSDEAQEALDYVKNKAQKTKEKAESEGKSSDEIMKAVKKARSRAINAKSEVWRNFAQNVKSISQEKCWYCESSEDRSHMPVDHFRPKNKVTDCDEHNGYWWLAFVWENYRYCCTLCNSRTSNKDNDTEGGKQNYFPLLDGSPRVMDEGPITDEQPVLLDPFIYGDTELLSFYENGIPTETNKDKNSIEYLRANTSIELFHLHHDKAVRSRKRIAKNLINLVEEVEGLYIKKTAGENTIEAINLRMKDIATYIDEFAKYRTAARLYLKGRINENNKKWVQNILDRT